jgi:hypothetical protein
MTEHPYAASSYEVFLAKPRTEGFDWHTAGVGALRDLDLRVRLAADLNHVIAVIRAIDAGRMQGRQVDWGAWLGPVAVDEIRPLLHDLGLQLPPDVEDLGTAPTWYVVAVET